MDRHHQGACVLAFLGGVTTTVCGGLAGEDAPVDSLDFEMGHRGVSLRISRRSVRGANAVCRRHRTTTGPGPFDA